MTSTLLVVTVIGSSNSLAVQARECGRITMDRDTEATLQRKNMRSESDKMTKNERWKI
jgi:hypothetical protein